MWKPGEEKPSQATSSSSSSSSRMRTVIGNGHPSITSTQFHDNDTNISPSHNTTPPTKNLSGQTLRMRFMQKGSREPESSRMDISQIEDAGSDDDDSDSGRGDGGITLATQSDMYGAPWLGRRSFGGFNKPMETAYLLSRSSLKQSSNRDSASDQELLKRYKDFVHGGRRRNRFEQDPNDHDAKKPKRRKR